MNYLGPFKERRHKDLPEKPNLETGIITEVIYFKEPGTTEKQIFSKKGYLYILNPEKLDSIFGKQYPKSNLRTWNPTPGTAEQIRKSIMRAAE